jgi:hypothetical protein
MAAHCTNPRDGSARPELALKPSARICRPAQSVPALAVLEQCQGHPAARCPHMQGHALRRAASGMAQQAGQVGGPLVPLLPLACFSLTRSRLRTACARSVPDSSATCAQTRQVRQASPATQPQYPEPAAWPRRAPCHADLLRPIAALYRTRQGDVTEHQADAACKTPSGSQTGTYGMAGGRRTCMSRADGLNLTRTASNAKRKPASCARAPTRRRRTARRLCSIRKDRRARCPTRPCTG